ncbi:MAG: thermonuclease family protein, partial [Victivallales bacterium]|nr:thermonuclease family protein [Victivallales bacterium]
LMSVSRAKGKTLLFILFFAVSLICQAGNYELSSIEIIDGDTIKADIHLGFDIVLKKQSIRLSGIDTPEIRTRNLLEKEAGLLVKKWLIVQVENGKSFKLVTSKKERGKFGRPLGILFIDGVDLCRLMLINKYAVSILAKPSQTGFPAS